MRVFMCYSHQDMPFVDGLVKDLRQHGISVWRDVDNIPGHVSANTSGWRDAVDRALNECSHLIVALSPDSANSSEVAAEWNYFLLNNKPVLPVIARDCQIPYRLFSLQYYDFRQGYETTFKRLISGLTGVPTHEGTKPRPAYKSASPIPVQAYSAQPPLAAGSAVPAAGAAAPPRRAGSGRAALMVVLIAVGVLAISACACWAMIALSDSLYY